MTPKRASITAARFNLTSGARFFRNSLSSLLFFLMRNTTARQYIIITSPADAKAVPVSISQCKSPSHKCQRTAHPLAEYAFTADRFMDACCRLT